LVTGYLVFTVRRLAGRFPGPGGSGQKGRPMKYEIKDGFKAGARAEVQSLAGWVFADVWTTLTPSYGPARGHLSDEAARGAWSLVEGYVLAAGIVLALAKSRHGDEGPLAMATKIDVMLIGHRARISVPVPFTEGEFVGDLVRRAQAIGVVFGDVLKAFGYVCAEEHAS
jgi:hypothetical protein